ncbi:MAG: hypothetical protein FD160_3773 [Caulobacteraceae bacterium]|nr:MAG: hypothetical protein FD160_3773 [Caulobacteraceae bacterium]
MTSTMELQCKLSEPEILARGRRLAAIGRELSDAQRVLESAKEVFKFDDKRLAKERARLEDEVNNGFAYRQVATSKTIVEGVCTITRDDTMQIVGTRPATSNELQLQMYKDEEREGGIRRRGRKKRGEDDSADLEVVEGGAKARG